MKESKREIVLKLYLIKFVLLTTMLIFLIVVTYALTMAISFISTL